MNSQQPMISVVITTCKRPIEMLQRAIDSVMGQDYSDYETIVVDDSPESYECREAVKTAITQKYPQIRYISHDECKGACISRNDGVQFAKGEFVAFLDDDDEWRANKLSEMMKMFTNDNIAIVYCGYSIVNDDNMDERIADVDYRSGSVFDQLIKYNFIGSTSIPIIRKKYLIAVGGFDPQMKSSQDYDAWLRLASKYHVECVKKDLVKYHVHSGDQISKNPQKKIDGLERLLSKNEEYLSAHKEALWIRKIKIAPFYSAAKGFGAGLKKWFSAMIIRPLKISTNLRYFILVYRKRKR